MAEDLLARPHHDGSALYVSDLSPAPGAPVDVKVRVPRTSRVTEVHVRQVVDAEPQFVTARIVRQDAEETWWEARMTCHNPVTSYRFLLVDQAGGYQWLNGTGLHHRDVPDSCDFRIVTYGPPPDWALDAVVYQVFPDRFARASQAPDVAEIAPDWAIMAGWDEPVARAGDEVARQLYGGDLDGIREHLDHLQHLGVTVVYLTPFFPARSNHRYDASSFESVDPILGGTAALDRLVDAARQRGLRVIGDLTTNHTGSAHDWFTTAQNDPGSPHRQFYFFSDDGDYVGWLGVPSLPKLNYDAPGLTDAMFDRPDAVVRRWLTGPHALDGWRVDVANMTGRHEGQDLNHDVARRMRVTMQECAPDALVVAEHAHDHSLDAMGSGWHGVMNYSGFTRPLWTWLRAEESAPRFLGSPAMVPRLDGAAVAETMDEFGALVPWRSRTHSFNLAGSHDTTRVRTLVGDDPALVRVAAGLVLTMPGIPMITYGDEVGMRGMSGEDGRRPMPWDQATWDTETFEAYQELIRLRRTLDPLRRGGFRWAHIGDNALVFLRETAREAVLVHCARSAHPPVRLPAARLPGIGRGERRFGGTITVGRQAVVLCADGPQMSIWSWSRSET